MAIKEKSICQKCKKDFYTNRILSHTCRGCGKVFCDEHYNMADHDCPAMPKDDFFSKSRGSVQRLPNGNTLITESDKGYVFEVTPKKEIVWRFANPDIEDGIRQAIWRMTRFVPNDPRVAFVHR